MFNKLFIKLLVLLFCLGAYPQTSFGMVDDDIVLEEVDESPKIIERYRKKLASYDRENRDYKEKAKKWKAKIVQLIPKELDSITETIEGYRKKRDSYDREKADYQEKIEEWNAEIGKLMLKELSLIKEAIEHYKEKLASYDREKADYQEKIEEWNAEIGKLKSTALNLIEKTIEHYIDQQTSYDSKKQDYRSKIDEWEIIIGDLKIKEVSLKREAKKLSKEEQEEIERKERVKWEEREERARIQGIQIKENKQKFKNYYQAEKKKLNDLLKEEGRKSLSLSPSLSPSQVGSQYHLEENLSHHSSSLEYTAMLIFPPESWGDASTTSLNLVHNGDDLISCHHSILKRFDENFFNAQIALRELVKGCPRLILYTITGGVVITYGAAFFIDMTGMENNFVGNLLKTQAEGATSIATFVISGLVNFPFGSLLSYNFIKKLLFKKQKSFKPLPPIDEEERDEAYVFNQSWFEVIVKNTAGAGAALSLGGLGGALWGTALRGFGIYEYSMLPIVMFGFGKPIWDFGRKEISRIFVRRKISHDSVEMRRFLVFDLEKLKEKIKNDDHKLTQNLWDRIQKQSGYFGKNEDVYAEYKISLLSTLILTNLDIIELDDEQEEVKVIDRTTLTKELPTSLEKDMASKAAHVATGLYLVPGFAVDAGAFKVFAGIVGVGDNTGTNIGYGLAGLAAFRLLLEFGVHKAAYKNWWHPLSPYQRDYPGIRRGLSLYSTFTGVFFATLLATVAYNVCKDYPSVILVPFVFITAFRYFTIFQQAASHLYHKAATAVFLRNNYDAPEQPKENNDAPRPRAGSINSDVHIQVNDDGSPQSLLQEVNEQAPLVANKVNEPTIQAKKAHLFEIIRKLINHIKYKASDKTIEAIARSILKTE